MVLRPANVALLPASGLVSFIGIFRGVAGEEDGRPARVSIRASTCPARWMLRRSLWMACLWFMAFISSAYGKDFVVRRNVEGYTLDVAMNRNPPILGKNDIRVEIKDSQGKSVVDAPVTINYFMPPMPGMAPMNYTVNAAPRDGGYGATMDLIMQGPWNIVIRAGVAGKRLRMAVLIDVR
ncbi:MAG: FixH family protein [Thermodesulfobacteriota bacterium]